MLFNEKQLQRRAALRQKLYFSEFKDICHSYDDVLRFRKVCNVCSTSKLQLCGNNAVRMLSVLWPQTVMVRASLGRNNNVSVARGRQQSNIQSHSQEECHRRLLDER